jgi:hypothetical protein
LKLLNNNIQGLKNRLWIGFQENLIISDRKKKKGQKNAKKLALVPLQLVMKTKDIGNVQREQRI